MMALYSVIFGDLMLFSVALQTILYCNYGEEDCGVPTWFGDTIEDRLTRDLLMRVVPRFGFCVDFNHYDRRFVATARDGISLKMAMKIDITDSIKVGTYNNVQGMLVTFGRPGEIPTHRWGKIPQSRRHLLPGENYYLGSVLSAFFARVPAARHSIVLDTVLSWYLL